MSITLMNSIQFNHEVAKRAAMEVYPIDHPARFAVWQEYNVNVVGAESYYMSEFVIMAIWKSLVSNGWPQETSMFPCSGMKRLALISALERLQDLSCKSEEELASKMGFLRNEALAFNTQKVTEALPELIQFLYCNEEVFS